MNSVDPKPKPKLAKAAALAASHALFHTEVWLSEVCIGLSSCLVQRPSGSTTPVTMRSV